MKVKVIIAGILCVALVSCSKDDEPLVVKNETITMNAGYANDIYYNLTSGVVSTVPRTNWDIAFQTPSRTSTIIINGGAGIKLFTYPYGDVSSWSSVDISGIDTWKPMNNSDTTWSLGAFERNALGHPDYGWGIYNMLTHDVTGDSLFIIQLADQSYRKLWIKKKESVNNRYVIQYAGIDGSGEVTETVECNPYTGKNFIYYSFTSKNVIDREPAADAWDFVVTRYLEMIEDDAGGRVPYPVIGVLTNIGVRSAEVNDTDIASNDYSAAKFVTTISDIGSDWKSYSMTTNQWTLEDNRVYFVRDREQSVYKIVFTAFEGSSTGNLKFDITKLK